MTPWTVACQASLSMEFSRQEYCSGLPLLSPGDLPNPGIEPGSPALQVGALPSQPPEKSLYFLTWGTTAPQNLESMDLMGRKSRNLGLQRTTLLILKYLSIKYRCIPSKKGFAPFPNAHSIFGHLLGHSSRDGDLNKNPTGLSLHS